MHLIKLAELSCSHNNASFLVTERCQWENTDQISTLNYSCDGFNNDAMRA